MDRWISVFSYVGHVCDVILRLCGSQCIYLSAHPHDGYQYIYGEVFIIIIIIIIIIQHL